MKAIIVRTSIPIFDGDRNVYKNKHKIENPIVLTIIVLISQDLFIILATLADKRINYL